MELNPYEVIVVGSGASGGVAALTLAKAGIKVLVIDAGKELSIKQAFRSEPENSIQRFYGLITGEYRKQAQHPGFWKTNPLLYANEKENKYLTPNKRPFIWTQGQQVGGRSLTWGGITLRLSDYDLKASVNDGFGPSWPIEYSDLCSHYSNLETLLRIHGHYDGLAQLPDGKYVGETPFTECEKFFAEKIESRLGYKVIHSRGFEEYNYNNKKPEWPRFSSPGSTLKLAISTGKVQILSNHIAENLIMNSEKSKAKGIIVVNKKNNNRIFLKSNLIIICASTIQTLRLLLNSQENNNEDGFIDPSASLGLNLMDHISSCRFFSMPNSNKNLNEVSNKKKNVLSGSGSFFIPFGNRHKIFNNVDFIRGYGIWGGIDRFQLPNFIKRNPNSKIGFLIGHGEVLANKNNKVTLSEIKDKWGIKIPNIDCKWGENERKMVKHMNKTIEEIIVNADGEINSLEKLLYLPFIDKLTKNAIALQEQSPPPGYYIHEVGGAPMGNNEESSVVDNWNRLWRCPNVLVVDGACWPTSSWQSPTLTIMAITRRACLQAIKPQKG